MAAENMIFSIILLMSAAILILIGIVQYRSKEPVGFWSGKKPLKKEQITDVKAYNRKHGLMWILFGAGLIVCFLCGTFFGGNIAGYLCLVEMAGGIVVMIAYHGKLDRMYRRREQDR